MEAVSKGTHTATYEKTAVGSAFFLRLVKERLINLNGVRRRVSWTQTRMAVPP